MLYYEMRFMKRPSPCSSSRSWRSIRTLSPSSHTDFSSRLNIRTFSTALSTNEKRMTTAKNTIIYIYQEIKVIHFSAAKVLLYSQPGKAAQWVVSIASIARYL